MSRLKQCNSYWYEYLSKIVKKFKTDIIILLQRFLKILKGNLLNRELCFVRNEQIAMTNYFNDAVRP